MKGKTLFDAEMYEDFKKRYGGHTTAELRQRHASLRADRQIAGKTARQVLTQQLQMLDQLLKEKGAAK